MSLMLLVTPLARLLLMMRPLERNAPPAHTPSAPAGLSFFGGSEPMAAFDFILMVGGLVSGVCAFGILGRLIQSADAVPPYRLHTARQR
jgi:hypothetical protein